MTAENPLSDPQWFDRGFEIAYHNNDKHVVFHHPDIQFCAWPTNQDARGHVLWMIFGKTFHAGADTVLRLWDEGRLVMPDDASKGTCRSCNTDIWWVKTRNGKNLPLDATGEAHFATCPQADEHRKRKPPGRAR